MPRSPGFPRAPLARSSAPFLFMGVPIMGVLLTGPFLMGLSQCGGDADDDGWTSEQGDCNDSDSSIFPGAPEHCNGIDEDCDGDIDEGVTHRFYPDADGDGIGSSGPEVAACLAPAGHVITSDDCRGEDPAVFPGALELPGNGQDDDCDDQVDEIDVSGLSAGMGFSMALESSGRLSTWGRNDAGQLGDGTYTSRSSPASLSTLRPLLRVSSGDRHTLAIDQTRALWAWGANDAGQLGDGTRDDRPTPIAVNAGCPALNVSGGFTLSLLVCIDGTVQSWGTGWLGNGTFTSRSQPETVDGLQGMLEVSGGGAHALALAADGTVWAWGSNRDGQLGDGTFDDHPVPFQVPGLQGITAVAAGYAHSLALGADGVVWTWGDNTWGQLGDGSQIDRPSPVQVLDVADAVAISEGYGHAYALTASGDVWAWGLNDAGQLGNGTTLDQARPVCVLNLPPIASIEGGIESGSNHGLALASPYDLWAWGENGDGELGTDPSTAYSTLPIEVPELR